MNNPTRWAIVTGAFALFTTYGIQAAGPAPDKSDVKNVVTGTAAFTSYETESPGTFRKITVGSSS